MTFRQSDLNDLANRYTEAWNSKIPKKVAEFHLPTSQITINRGEPSVGHDGLTEMPPRKSTGTGTYGACRR
mgnify:CR=1 FL=1